jgi:hypothetical protein
MYRLSRYQGQPGQVWKIFPPTGIQRPVRPDRGEALYGLRYAGPQINDSNLDYDFRSLYSINMTQNKYALRTLFMTYDKIGSGGVHFATSTKAQSYYCTSLFVVATRENSR